MRLLTLALAAASLIASTAFASPTAPKNGVEYQTLAAPQPVQAAGKKVEVIEFFMYHCPHCNGLEPLIAEWVKKAGDKVAFRRVHIPYSGPNDPEAHLYLTLEAMGNLNVMHDKVFHAWHVEHLRLNKDDVIIDWVAKNGVDKAKFIEFYNSFGVLTKLKRLQQITATYKIESAPMFVIDGRFVTSPSIIDGGTHKFDEVAGQKATIEVIDALVTQVMKSKGVEPASKGGK